MAQNRNTNSGHYTNGRISDSHPDLYLGLSVSPDSIGWAVTDQHYNILKLKRKST